MHTVMNTSNASYVSCRAGIYYYTSSSRLSFSLRTKSYAGAIRAASSVTQRPDDYWLGLRIQKIDFSAIHLVKKDDVNDTSPVILDVAQNREWPGQRILWLEGLHPQRPPREVQ